MKRHYLGVLCAAASSANLRNGFYYQLIAVVAANSIGTEWNGTIYHLSGQNALVNEVGGGGGGKWIKLKDKRGLHISSHRGCPCSHRRFFFSQNFEVNFLNWRKKYKGRKIKTGKMTVFSCIYLLFLFFWVLLVKVVIIFFFVKEINIDFFL